MLFSNRSFQCLAKCLGARKCWTKLFIVGTWWVGGWMDGCLGGFICRMLVDWLVDRGDGWVSEEMVRRKGGRKRGLDV